MHFVSYVSREDARWSLTSHSSLKRLAEHPNYTPCDFPRTFLSSPFGKIISDYS